MFPNAPAAIDRRLRVVVGQATGRGESASPKARLSHTASSSAHCAGSKNCPSSDYGSPKVAPLSAMPNTPGALDFRDRLGYGA